MTPPRAAAPKAGMGVAAAARWLVKSDEVRFLLTLCALGLSTWAVIVAYEVKNGSGVVDRGREQPVGADLEKMIKHARSVGVQVVQEH